MIFKGEYNGEGRGDKRCLLYGNHDVFKQDVGAHGLAVGNYGLLVLITPVPAVQLYTSDGRKQIQKIKIQFLYFWGILSSLTKKISDSSCSTFLINFSRTIVISTHLSACVSNHSQIRILMSNKVSKLLTPITTLHIFLFLFVFVLLFT